MACLLAFGCQAQPPRPVAYADQVALSTSVRFETIQGSTAVRYRSGTVAGGIDEDRTAWTFFAEKDRASGVTRYLVRWRNTYSARKPRRYLRATDSYGGPLVTTIVESTSSCRVFGCTFTEALDVVLSDAQIAGRRPLGVAFLLYSDDGASRTISVPPEVVSAVVLAAGADTGQPAGVYGRRSKPPREDDAGQRDERGGDKERK